MKESAERNRPSTLRRMLDAWKRFGKKLGDIQARFILIVFYFLVLGPFALAARCWGDPLAIKGGKRRGWLVRDDKMELPLERATKQF